MAIVTLKEIKKHLEIDADETRDDEYLYQLLQVAEAEAAAHINVVLSTFDPVPVAIKHAIKIRTKYLFDVDRGEVIQSRYSKTNSFHRLLSPYIDYGIA